MTTAPTLTQSPRTAQIATMVEYLQPHAGSLKRLRDAMPAAFLYAVGRAVDKDDHHDLFICDAVLSYFPDLAPPEPVSYRQKGGTMICFDRIDSAP